jgi:lysophospholipase L1-like esterase
MVAAPCSGDADHLLAATPLAVSGRDGFSTHVAAIPSRDILLRGITSCRHPWDSSLEDRATPAALARPPARAAAIPLPVGSHERAIDAPGGGDGARGDDDEGNRRMPVTRTCSGAARALCAAAWVVMALCTARTAPAASAIAGDAQAGDAAAATRPAAKITIVLAGDSTVTDSAGWGKGFAACLSDDVKCTNLSRGGRSSKSFIREGLWKKCLDLKPDYVLIQFGHNDQPGHPGDRVTDPQTTYRQFMTQYVDDARAAGIKPVLVTSLSRRQWGADGKIHSTLVPYVEVVKQIAAEKRVPLIDLHARSIELYEKLGPEKVKELEPLKAPKPDDAKPAPRGQKVYDGTHLNAKGSAVIGRIVAAELKRAVPMLAPQIRSDDGRNRETE